MSGRSSRIRPRRSPRTAFPISASNRAGNGGYVPKPNASTNRPEGYQTMVTYNRAFQHQDWIDNQDIVQAGGERGFNAEFHGLEVEFDKIGGAIAQLSAGLGAFQPVGAAGAVAYAGGNVGIGTTFTTAAPPAYSLEVNLGD